MKSSIAVIGSSNTDLVVSTESFPKPGETVHGFNFSIESGGKGANQAVSAARLGAQVNFISRIGNDMFGKGVLAALSKENIDTSAFIIDEETPSGVALITLDQNAENMIVVAGGSNMKLSPDDLNSRKDKLVGCEYWLTQCETPVETIQYLSKQSNELSKKLIINPAPFIELPQECFDGLYMLTPNQTEAQGVSGVEVNSVEDAKVAAGAILSLGVSNVVITLGANGCFVMNEEIQSHIKGIEVEAVDTTGAGDVFNGALVTALAEGKNLVQAAEFAVCASALSVQKRGAQTGVPYLNDVNQLLAK